jgi:GR25 family glycosyltransferase involved in LPS biosynthesis
MNAFYINLDRRTDRRAEFEQGSIVAERFPAIEHTVPAIGCTRSHLEVLRLARERQYPCVGVFEDDFQCLVPQDTLHTILQSFPDDYDVVMLDYYILHSEPYNDGFDRVLEAQAGSAYVVHSRFYDTLIKTYEEAVELFEQHPHCHWLYINDQYWKRLQPHSRWYMSRVRIGRQRPGYSDLKQAVLENEY